MRFGRLTGQREVFITPFAYPEQKGGGYLPQIMRGTNILHFHAIGGMIWCLCDTREVGGPV